MQKTLSQPSDLVLVHFLLQHRLMLLDDYIKLTSQLRGDQDGNQRTSLALRLYRPQHANLGDLDVSALIPTERKFASLHRYLWGNLECHTYFLLLT